jgi:hypothetical protein
MFELARFCGQPRRAILDAIRRAFESAAVDFIDENGGGSGLRLRKLQRSKQSKKKGSSGNQVDET